MAAWGKKKDIAEYAGMSQRTIDEWLKNGLRHSRLPSGTILIRFQWIDEYLEGFEAVEDEVDRVVGDVLKGLENESKDY